MPSSDSNLFRVSSKAWSRRKVEMRCKSSGDGGGVAAVAAVVALLFTGEGFCADFDSLFLTIIRTTSLARG